MIIPVDYAQANLRFGGTGFPLGAEVTLGFNIETYAGDADQMAFNVLDLFSSNGVQNNLSDDVSLVSCSTKFGPNSTGAAGEYFQTVNGQISGDCTPPNTAILVKKITPQGGRTGRGRFYLPGLPEAGCAPGGGLAGTYRSDIQTTMDNWVADLEAIGLLPALLHSPSSPVSAPLLVTSWTVDSKVATQRKRLRR